MTEHSIDFDNSADLDRPLQKGDIIKSGENAYLTTFYDGKAILVNLSNGMLYATEPKTRKRRTLLNRISKINNQQATLICNADIKISL